MLRHEQHVFPQTQRTEVTEWTSRMPTPSQGWTKGLCKVTQNSRSNHVHCVKRWKQSRADTCDHVGSELTETSTSTNRREIKHKENGWIRWECIGWQNSEFVALQVDVRNRLWEPKDISVQRWYAVIMQASASMRLTRNRKLSHGKKRGDIGKSAPDWSQMVVMQTYRPQCRAFEPKSWRERG